jgi:hypothetical protein
MFKFEKCSSIKKFTFFSKEKRKKDRKTERKSTTKNYRRKTKTAQPKKK